MFGFSSSTALVLCSMYIRTWWIQLYRSYKYKGKFARTGISTSNDHNSYLITAGAKILIFYESVILGHFRGVRRTAQWCSVVKTCPRDLLTLPMSAAKCRKMLWISPEMMSSLCIVGLSWMGLRHGNIIFDILEPPGSAKSNAKRSATSKHHFNIKFHSNFSMTSSVHLNVVYPYIFSITRRKWMWLRDFCKI